MGGPRGSVGGCPVTAAGVRESILRVRSKAREKLPHLSRFTAVGGAGLVVNQGLFSLMASESPADYLLAATLATVGSTTFNFAGIESWVFRSRGRRGFGGMARRFAAYGAVNGAALFLRLPLLYLLSTGLHVNYLLANLMTLLALTLARFALSDRLIWPSRQPIPAEAP